MKDGDPSDDLVSEVRRLAANLDPGEPATIQRYAEAVGRLVSADVGPDVLRQADVLSVDTVEVRPGELTESDREIVAAIDDGDVDAVRNQLLRDGLPASTVDEIVTSLQALIARRSSGDDKW